MINRGSSPIYHKVSIMNRIILPAIVWMLLCGFNLPVEKDFLGQKAADIPVFNAKGDTFPFFSMLGEKSLIICPVYTKCKTYCGLISNGIHKAIKESGGLGKDFRVVSFSFDSTDTAEDLDFYNQLYRMDGVNWQTISASQEHIAQMMSSIGFEYEYDPNTKEFNHPSYLVVLTPSGRISRFIYGLEPSKKDIELAGIEAMSEKVRPGLFRGFYLRCFGYDPVLKTYKVDWRFIFSTSAGLLIVSLVSSIFIKSFIVTKE